MPNTKAIRELNRLGVEFTIQYFAFDKSIPEIALQTACGLAVDPKSLLKTLIINSRDGPISALIPADRRLDFKALASITGSKKFCLMDLTAAEELTGYTRGGISPIAQNCRLPTYIDRVVQKLPEVICSGGKRGINLRLSPIELARVCNDKFANISTQDATVNVG